MTILSHANSTTVKKGTNRDRNYLTDRKHACTVIMKGVQVVDIRYMYREQQEADTMLVWFLFIIQAVDIENGQDTEITLDSLTLNLYQERLHAWLTEMASYSASRAIHYIPVTTNQPWEKLILHTLRTQGMIK